MNNSIKAYLYGSLLVAAGLFILNKGMQAAQSAESGHVSVVKTIAELALGMVVAIIGFIVYRYYKNLDSIPSFDMRILSSISERDKKNLRIK